MDHMYICGNPHKEKNSEHKYGLYKRNWETDRRGLAGHAR